MLILISGIVWAGAVAALLGRVLHQFRRFRGSAIAPVDSPAVSSSVAIIVPVRDEIANLDRCLDAVVAQTGFSRRIEVIVVDDGSQDGTKAAAERRAVANPQITVIEAGALPPGWAGKPHACWRGAALADSDWLCFIDADVSIAPGLVAAAVATAETGGIDMVSLQPLQELGSFWERSIIPAGMLVIACAKRFDQGSPDVVNGQFLLIRREAYFAVGGHAAVHAEICEDRALAVRLRDRGFRLRVLAGEGFARTRMYRDLPSLWEGFSKNATEILGSAGATITVAVAAVLFGWTALLAPAATLCGALARPSVTAVVGAVLAFVGTGAVVGIHFGTARHFRIPVVYSLTFAIGYAAVACLAFNGVVQHWRGHVTWKGRTYQLTKTSDYRA